MSDPYSSWTAGLTSPAIDGTAVTPSDSEPLTTVSRALYVGSGGSIRAELASGAQVDFIGVPAGSLLPVRVKQIRASGTSASEMVALW